MCVTVVQMCSRSSGVLYERALLSANELRLCSACRALAVGATGARAALCANEKYIVVAAPARKVYILYSTLFFCSFLGLFARSSDHTDNRVVLHCINHAT